MAESGVPDLSRVTEKWDALVEAMRSGGKSMAATALEQAAPVAVSPRGDVTIALDEANPIYEQSLESSKGEIVQMLRTWFSGVGRVTIRPGAVSAVPRERLTDEMVRAERLASLRRKDPVLDKAIDTLDLELAD